MTRGAGLCALRAARSPLSDAERHLPLLQDVNVDLGYCYHSEAIAADSSDPTPVLHEHPRTLAGRPGSRAPRVPLARQSEQISSIDLLGRDWALLAGADGHGWMEAAAAVLRALPLQAHQVNGPELRDPSGLFHEAFGITPSGAVLVRPRSRGLARSDWRGCNASGAIGDARSLAGEDGRNILHTSQRAILGLVRYVRYRALQECPLFAGDGGGCRRRFARPRLLLHHPRAIDDPACIEAIL
jgi:hypothetical protein